MRHTAPNLLMNIPSITVAIMRGMNELGENNEVTDDLLSVST